MAQKILITILSLSALLTTNVKAELAPTRLTADARIVTFDYDKSKIYPILSKRLTHTNIEFPQDDPIVTVMASDPQSFVLTVNKARDNLFIKPKFDHIDTPLTVITEKKKYQFVVKSGGPNDKYYQQVSFQEAEQGLFEFENNIVQHAENAKMDNSAKREENSIDPSRLNMVYTIEGSSRFKPTSVFDDGRQMWITFPDNLVERPAIFGNSPDGLYLVNAVTSPQNNNIVNVQQLVDELVLKIGNEQVTVKRGRKTLFGWSS